MIGRPRIFISEHLCFICGLLRRSLIADGAVVPDVNLSRFSSLQLNLGPLEEGGGAQRLFCVPGIFREDRYAGGEFGGVGDLKLSPVASRGLYADPLRQNRRPRREHGYRGATRARKPLAPFHQVPLSLREETGVSRQEPGEQSMLPAGFYHCGRENHQRRPLNPPLR